MKSHKITTAPIPMRNVGPVKVIGDEVNDEVMVPLATYESPLWPSVGRGARVTKLAGGIRATVIDDRMSRSILLEADNASVALQAVNSIKARIVELNEVVAESSRFAKLIGINSQLVANLIYLRLEFTTGDASGHNMVTNAADRLFWSSTRNLNMSLFRLTIVRIRRLPRSTVFWGAVNMSLPK